MHILVRHDKGQTKNYDTESDRHLINYQREMRPLRRTTNWGPLGNDAGIEHFDYSKRIRLGQGQGQRH